MVKIQKNVILAPYTTFKIGGPAKFFCEVKNEEELKEALKYAKENNLEFFVLGGGSNVLVNDRGFNGIIIKVKIQNSKFKITTQSIDKYFIECWAGDSLADLVSFTAENSLTGLEWAAGIPGTIGGAVRGNARAFGKCMGMVIESVRLLDVDGPKIVDYNNQQCGFAYWGSAFKKNKNLIIVSVNVSLGKGKKEKIQQEIKNIINTRMAMHPREVSPGSFFLNPIVAEASLRREFEIEKNMKYKDDKLPAGWLIEKVGMRGKKIGDAMVSEKHANFIINTGKATAQDVIALTNLVKQQVRDKFGVELQEEVQFIGF